MSSHACMHTWWALTWRTLVNPRVVNNGRWALTQENKVAANHELLLVMVFV